MSRPGPKRQQRINNRKAKRGRRQANFQQSGFYDFFHKDKPKGFRGHQAIGRSTSGGLTGKLGLKEKIQDVFKKEGHDDCPTFTVDKNGNKTCTNPNSGGSSSTIPITKKKTDDESSRNPIGLGFPKLKFPGPGFNLSGFKVDAGGMAKTGDGWHPPMELPNEMEGTADAFITFSKTGNSPDENAETIKKDEAIVSESFDEDNDKSNDDNTVRRIKADF